MPARVCRRTALRLARNLNRRFPRKEICGSMESSTPDLDGRPVGRDGPSLPRQEDRSRQDGPGRSDVRRGGSVDCPGRQLLARSSAGFRSLKGAFKRFRRWTRRGVFDRMFEATTADADLEHAMVDGIAVRVHRHGRDGPPQAKKGDRKSGDRAFPRGCDDQNSRADRRLGHSCPLRPVARPASRFHPFCRKEVDMDGKAVFEGSAPSFRGAARFQSVGE